jgi:hypothetical protein
VADQVLRRELHGSSVGTDRPAAALRFAGDGMQDARRSLQLLPRDLVDVGVIAEASSGRVVAGASLGDRDREQLDGGGCPFGLDVDEADLDLVWQGAGDEELVVGHLTVALGQLRATDVVERVSVVPALAWDAQDAAGSDHVVDQLLGDRGVGLPGGSAALARRPGRGTRSRRR